jgi:hypothetical protein
MTDQIKCHDLIASYLDHLGEEFSVRTYQDSGCHVVTPYWRPDGDHIEFFAIIASDGSLVLTDEGQTIDWLFSVGMGPEGGQRRQELFEKLLERYRLTEKNGIISVKVASSNIGIGIHNFLAGLQSISHLTVMRIPRGLSTFKDEVENYLLDNGQKYEPNFRIHGKTIEHRVDFYLNSKRNALVAALTANSSSSARNAAVRVAFQWIDIREAGWEYHMITVIDDSEDRAERFWNKGRIRKPLEEYSNQIIPWSQKGRLLGSLASTVD